VGIAHPLKTNTFPTAHISDVPPIPAIPAGQVSPRAPEWTAIGGDVSGTDGSTHGFTLQGARQVARDEAVDDLNFLRSFARVKRSRTARVRWVAWAGSAR